MKGSRVCPSDTAPISNLHSCAILHSFWVLSVSIYSSCIIISSFSEIFKSFMSNIHLLILQIELSVSYELYLQNNINNKGTI